MKHSDVTENAWGVVLGEDIWAGTLATSSSSEKIRGRASKIKGTGSVKWPGKLRNRKNICVTGANGSRKRRQGRTSKHVGLSKDSGF